MILWMKPFPELGWVTGLVAPPDSIFFTAALDCEVLLGVKGDFGDSTTTPPGAGLIAAGVT